MKTITKKEYPSETTQQIQQFVTLCSEFMPQRNKRLFAEFLPTGYQLVTLSCVPATQRAELLIAKVCLGIFITLMDDFADRPDMQNTLLLENLYEQRFITTKKNTYFDIDASELHAFDKKTLQFGQFIFEKLKNNLVKTTHYDQYKTILDFDLQQIYNCNRYFQLASCYPTILNKYEVTYLSAFNMGMVMAGHIDLLASPNFNAAEMSIIREFLHHAQRFGKLCNNEATFTRELRENDYKNELFWADFSVMTPEQEMSTILQRLAVLAEGIHTFNGLHYIDGLQALRKLHQDASDYI